GLGLGWRFPRRNALLGGTTTAADALNALRHIGSPSRLVEGPDIQTLERAFAAAVGARHAISFAAGRGGLYGILQCLGIGAGNEVLVQAPTHIVVANAIRYTGARPVYADCEHATYNIDLDTVEERISERTRALVLQHTFGIPVDIGRASAIADR